MSEGHQVPNLQDPTENLPEPGSMESASKDHLPTSQAAMDGHPAQSRTKKKKCVIIPREPPLFARKHHVIFRGNEKLDTVSNKSQV
jgi:hypothetical protein